MGDTENSKPVFVAPIDIKEGDVITMLFGEPIIITRDGESIWHRELPPFLIDLLSADNKP